MTGVAVHDDRSPRDDAEGAVLRRELGRRPERAGQGWPAGTKSLVNGREIAPGMCPLSYISFGRTSSSRALPVAAMRRTSSSVASIDGSSLAANVVGATAGRSVEVGRFSSLHRAKPPSRTAARRTPARRSTAAR